MSHALTLLCEKSRLTTRECSRLCGAQLSHSCVEPQPTCADRERAQIKSVSPPYLVEFTSQSIDPWETINNCLFFSLNHKVLEWFVRQKKLTDIVNNHLLLLNLEDHFLVLTAGTYIGHPKSMSFFHKYISGLYFLTPTWPCGWVLANRIC